MLSLGCLLSFGDACLFYSWHSGRSFVGGLVVLVCLHWALFACLCICLPFLFGECCLFVCFSGIVCSVVVLIWVSCTVMICGFLGGGFFVWCVLVFLFVVISDFGWSRCCCYSVLLFFVEVDLWWLWGIFCRCLVVSFLTWLFSFSFMVLFLFRVWFCALWFSFAIVGCSMWWLVVSLGV